jgi:hypothetical protein
MKCDKNHSLICILYGPIETENHNIRIRKKMFEEQRHCAKSEVEKTEVRHYPLSGRTIT